MDYDVFFSISQTPVDGRLPTEAEMFSNFFAEVEAADELGYGIAWIAESHFSTQVQKSHEKPVVPHWEGEIGLNADFLGLSHQVFARTKRIETGAAVMNILVNGGPIAAAERIGAFLALHGLDPEETRQIHVGFAAGRFDFMNRTTGIAPRDPIEEAAWPAIRGKVFAEATEIFLKLLKGETISSEDIRQRNLRHEDFRTEPDWVATLAAAGLTPDSGVEKMSVPRRFVFEPVKIVPAEFRRDLLDLVIGSHEPKLQEEANAILPVKVFNLSITRPEVIEDTHRRMAETYHADGGGWERGYMPRTVMVFLNHEPELDSEQRRAAAYDEAKSALSAYWAALQGTIDPKKVENAADNALIGNVHDVAEQVATRFHKDDRLMLWFDFFNHDKDRVIRNMTAFSEQVIPRVTEAIGR
jgi:alkanesulfonate monooxygenase SsuD/methylene tetrahydromethanopterin reductase-like flavin-dependent oxidoreductase (luciferase family)